MIALFGGSFDPIHLGHLNQAIDIGKHPDIDKVIWIPAKRSPFKNKGPYASEEERFQWIQNTIEEHPNMKISSFELHQSKESFTLNTVKHLIGRLKKPIGLIIGADHLQSLRKWYKFEELNKLVTFLIVSRPGYSLDETVLTTLKDFRVIKTKQHKISSSEIRKRIINGECIKSLVPPACAENIQTSSSFKT
jgi:nicotinate-nucleotide adenylyltransferase